MNGYEYLVQRNRLMCVLEDDLRKIENLPHEERLAATARLQAQFDLKLRDFTARAIDLPGCGISDNQDHSIIQE